MTLHLVNRPVFCLLALIVLLAQTPAAEANPWQADDPTSAIDPFAEPSANTSEAVAPENPDASATEDVEPWPDDSSTAQPDGAGPNEESAGADDADTNTQEGAPAESELDAVSDDHSSNAESLSPASDGDEAAADGKRPTASDPVSVPATAAPRATAPAQTAPATTGDNRPLDSDDLEPVAAAEPTPAPAAATLSPEVPPQLPPLSAEFEPLRAKVQGTLRKYFSRQLNTMEHSPWEMMHGIIAYGVESLFRRGGPRGPAVNAISYVAINGPGHGVRLLMRDSAGRIDAKIGPGLQGHKGQLLAILAQCHVPRDYPFTVEGKKFTLEDLIQTEMATCQADTELTFKLIGLAHYLDTNAVWQDERGGQWTISRLIREEIKQPILKTAACGGTHRLMGLVYAVNKRIQRGLPVDGEFQRALTYTQDYQKYAFALQNRDGSFSTKWFERREDTGDVDRKLKTSGHVIEWLAYSLTDEQLRDPRMVKAVDYLASSLLSDTERTWEVGPRGHALHALRIYNRRVFQQRSVSGSSQTLARRSRSAGAPRPAEAASTPAPAPVARRPAYREPFQPTPATPRVTRERSSVPSGSAVSIVEPSVLAPATREPAAEEPTTAPPATAANTTAANTTAANTTAADTTAADTTAADTTAADTTAADTTAVERVAERASRRAASVPPAPAQPMPADPAAETEQAGPKLGHPLRSARRGSALQHPLRTIIR